MRKPCTMPTLCATRSGSGAGLNESPRRSPNAAGSSSVEFRLELSTVFFCGERVKSELRPAGVGKAKDALPARLRTGTLCDLLKSFILVESTELGVISGKAVERAAVDDVAVSKKADDGRGAMGDSASDLSGPTRSPAGHVSKLNNNNFFKVDGVHVSEPEGIAEEAFEPS